MKNVHFFFRLFSVILGHYRPKSCRQHPRLCLLAHRCVFLRNIPIARSYGVKLSVLINNANLLFRVATLIDSPTSSIWECQFSFVLTNTWRHQTFLFLPIHGQKMVSCLHFFLDFSWEGAPLCVFSGCSYSLVCEWPVGAIHCFIGCFIHLLPLRDILQIFPLV